MAGWTQSELDAKYGWRGGRMAARYTDAMNRKRLALQAAARVASAPPFDPVRRGPTNDETNQIDRNELVGEVEIARAK